MPTRRPSRDKTTTTATSPEVASLVQRRAAVLYELGAAIGEIGAALQAVEEAQKAHTEAVAHAMTLQQRALAQGWTSEDLREAGLLVPATPGKRRRAPAASAAPGTGREDASESVDSPAGAGQPADDDQAS